MPTPTDGRLALTRAAAALLLWLAVPLAGAGCAASGPDENPTAAGTGAATPRAATTAAQPLGYLPAAAHALQPRPAVRVPARRVAEARAAATVAAENAGSDVERPENVVAAEVTR